MIDAVSIASDDLNAVNRLAVINDANSLMQKERKKKECYNLAGERILAGMHCTAYSGRSQLCNCLLLFNIF